MTGKMPKQWNPDLGSHELRYNQKSIFSLFKQAKFDLSLMKPYGKINFLQDKCSFIICLPNLESWY